LVLPEGYYASPKRIVKALEAMKHQKGMKKDCADIVSLPVLSPRIHPNLTSPVIV
jgi:hypothetical protein